MVYDAVDSSIPPRRIKCPEMVFHRAFTFARKHYIRHVWIDQESIDQNDPADISKHLKLMDQLYAQSSYTIAVLSNTLKIPEQVSAFTAMLQTTQNANTLEQASAAFTAMLRTTQNAGTLLIDALGHMFSDTWFTRTWTMHEQYCTWPASLFILVPIEPGITRFNGWWVLGNDICFDSLTLQNQLSHLSRHYRHSRTSSRDHLRVEVLDKCRMHLRSVTEHASTHGFTSISKMSRFTSWNMFRVLQDSKNLVVADRISIVGNVYGSPLRLLSERLDSHKYAYSTCMLALILVNRYREPVSRFHAINQCWAQLSRLSVTGLTDAEDLLREMLQVAELEKHRYWEVCESPMRILDQQNDEYVMAERLGTGESTRLRYIPPVFVGRR
jgi:hypothetical protein